MFNSALMTVSLLLRSSFAVRAYAAMLLVLSIEPYFDGLRVFGQSFDRGDLIQRPAYFFQGLFGIRNDMARFHEIRKA